MHRLPRWGLAGRVPALQAAVGPSGSLCRPPPDVMDDVSRVSVFFCVSSLFAHPLLRDGEDLLARLGGVIHLGRSGVALPLEGQCPVIEGVGLLVHREDEMAVEVSEAAILLIVVFFLWCCLLPFRAQAGACAPSCGYQTTRGVVVAALRQMLMLPQHAGLLERPVEAPPRQMRDCELRVAMLRYVETIGPDQGDD